MKSTQIFQAILWLHYDGNERDDNMITINIPTFQHEYNNEKYW